MDWPGAVSSPLGPQWEAHASAITTPLMRKACPLITLSLRSHFAGGVVAGGVEVAGVVVTPNGLLLPGGDGRKRMGSLVRSRSQNLVARRAILRHWAHCIMYYCQYYEDSYLMPLVVSSLTGDTSDVFNWMHSVTPGGTQDLSMLLQMLQEHYCGSFTFWEQRNMVENLCQGAREDATDFIIRVGSSVDNLAKDWKGQLTEAEVQSLQYEVSLNGVREEIWHVLDSEIARHGQLTPHQMYEAVTRYETYVARNKCLEGKSASPHIGHQRALAQTSGYKPHFHKTTTFAASVEESTDPALSKQGPSLPKEDDHLEGEPTQEEKEGLYIPSFLEKALGGDGNLQIKMAHTLQAQERRDKKCFICQSGHHLMKLPQDKLAWEMAKASPPGRAMSQGAPPK